MRKLLVVALVLVPVVALALGKAPVSKWDEGPIPSRGNYPAEVPRSQFGTVRIDSMVAYIRFLFEMKQAVILPEGDDYWFFFAYNDNHAHVRTKIFTETDVMNEPAWNVTDVYEWTGAGDLRYICPTAYYDGAVWYPEMTINTYPPTTDWHFVDEGGINVGLWTPPIDVLGPNYDYYLPLVEAGPDNKIFMDGQARDVANDTHVFKSFDGWDGTMYDPPGEVVVGPDDVWWSQGFENSQLLYKDGMIVVASGAYRTDQYTEPTNPLLVVYTCSTDEGNTWSDDTWLDQAVIPDMPGSYPGIQGYWSNQFFDGLIDDDGDLHFLALVTDSSCYNNEYYIHGLYDLHQDGGVWTASQVTDGVYYIDANTTWDPRSLIDGSSWIHGPSLALHPNGTLCAAWSDLGYMNPADSSLWWDIWYSWSADEGNTWHTPHRVTDTPEWNESFPRLLPTTTDDYAYVLTMYEWSDGPMDMVQFWPIEGADDPASAGPAISKLTTTPNPLADAAAVSFSLASPGIVEAGIYNTAGELVETLVRGSMLAGDHSLVWSARDAPAGVYVCRVKATGEAASARMVLVK